ncbi:MAG TPA: hypothetical protein VNB90_08115 [Cytophagaceae bacterium]|jgi:hypothetical protein|nr:hypothetical protein [Cytophagaceae bacterium]
MKKIIIIGLALVATTMFSCKKDYTCKCQKIHTTSNGTTTTDDGTYTFKDNKAGASSSCNDQEYTGTDLQGDYSRQCDLQ